MTLRALFRFLVAVLLFVSWSALTNHCALADLAAGPSEVGCAMHASLPSKTPKQNSAPACCKVLRALAAAHAYQAATPNLLPLATDVRAFALARLSAAPPSQFLPTKHATGPPGLGSFAESVLQQSLLAHAPPSLG